MTDTPTFTAFTAFNGVTLLARGSLVEVALAVKAAGEGAFLTFDDATGRVIDLDLRGSDAEIAARLTPAARGRGRPKLGVTAREVTLLPRQWDWLATQPGGASATLRRLVDQARRADTGPAGRRQRQEATYRFLLALAGDLPGYEEVTRALFAGDAAAFAQRMEDWPPDIRAHALRLSAP